MDEENFTSSLVAFGLNDMGLGHMTTATKRPSMLLHDFIPPPPDLSSESLEAPNLCMDTQNEDPLVDFQFSSHQFALPFNDQGSPNNSHHDAGVEQKNQNHIYRVKTPDLTFPCAAPSFLGSSANGYGCISQENESETSFDMSIDVESRQTESMAGSSTTVSEILDLPYRSYPQSWFDAPPFCQSALISGKTNNRKRQYHHSSTSVNGSPIKKKAKAGKDEVRKAIGHLENVLQSHPTFSAYSKQKSRILLSQIKLLIEQEELRGITEVDSVLRTSSKPSFTTGSTTSQISLTTLGIVDSGYRTQDCASGSSTPHPLNYGNGDHMAMDIEPPVGVKTTYECTKKECNYLTYSEVDWRRHETGDKHWPQERFMCLQCPIAASDLNGYPVCAFCFISFFTSGDVQAHYLQCTTAMNQGKTFGRKDHFCQHLRKEHDIDDTTQHAANWKYPVSSDWPRQCGFCGTVFQSWDERMKHIALHYRKGWKFKDWKVPFPRLKRSSSGSRKPGLHHWHDESDDDDGFDDNNSKPHGGAINHKSDINTSRASQSWNDRSNSCRRSSWQPQQSHGSNQRLLGDLFESGDWNDMKPHGHEQLSLTLKRYLNDTEDQVPGLWNPRDVALSERSDNKEEPILALVKVLVKHKDLLGRICPGNGKGIHNVGSGPGTGKKLAAGVLAQKTKHLGIVSPETESLLASYSKVASKWEAITPADEVALIRNVCLSCDLDSSKIISIFQTLCDLGKLFLETSSPSTPRCKTAKNFNIPPVVVLHSLPGRGKEHLAQHYISKHKADLPGGIFWVKSKLDPGVQDSFWDISCHIILENPSTNAIAMQFLEGWSRKSHQSLQGRSRSLNRPWISASPRPQSNQPIGSPASTLQIASGKDWKPCSYYSSFQKTGSQKAESAMASLSAQNPESREAEPYHTKPGNHTAFYQEWNEPQQSIQRFLTEPQKMLFMANHLFPLQAQSPQMDFNRPYVATGLIPHICEPSWDPPSFICSSATSPGTDIDWYHPRRNLEECSLSWSTSHISQGLPELEWPSKNLVHCQIPMINLREVQGFPDPEGVIFEDDDGFMDMKMEYIETDNRIVKQERSQGDYWHLSDEGISQSLKSEGSLEPKPSTIANGHTKVVDELKDNIHELEQPIAKEEEDQDKDYKPKASRNKRRRSSRSNIVSPSTPASKRNKVTKSVPRSKSQFQCKTCDHSAKDATALHKHAQAEHTRSYVCMFSFAGCDSTFSNKNEWKRHVYSQHLSLQYWLCDIGACSNSKASTSRSSSFNPSSQTKNSGNEFNRKDLFTQHLRRMHTPFPVKRQQKKTPEWEERIKELQVNCLKVRRPPPTKTKCPVRTCAQIFEGPTSWDERMEHVGRHFEKTSATSNGSAVSEIVEQESDEFMIEWALTERIIERKTSGGYRLHKDAGPGDGEDDDADCEDE